MKPESEPTLAELLAIVRTTVFANRRFAPDEIAAMRLHGCLTRAHKAGTLTLAMLDSALETVLEWCKDAAGRGVR